VVNLTELIVPREERFIQEELCHHTTNSPDINSRTISGTTKKEFWCTVPESDDLGGHGLDRMTIFSCQTKVSKFDFPFIVVENIREFDIPGGDKRR
jgi:hypothetical protein